MAPRRTFRALVMLVTLLVPLASAWRGLPGACCWKAGREGVTTAACASVGFVVQVPAGDSCCSSAAEHEARTPEPGGEPSAPARDPQHSHDRCDCELGCCTAARAITCPPAPRIAPILEAVVLARAPDTVPLASGRADRLLRPPRV